MTQSPSPALSYLCLALSMGLVGVYVALSKPLVAALPVFLLAWLRFGLGSLAMSSWLKKPSDEAPMTTATRGLVFLESLLGNFLFSICMLYGVSMTSAVNAGVIMASIPAVIAILSWIFLKERPATRVWLGVACAFLGVAMLSLDSTGPGKTASLLGNLLLCGAVICEAAYAVIGKKLAASVGPKRIAALINLWGFALMTPLGLWFAWSFDFLAVRSGVWLLLLFYSLAASVWTVWLWMTGLKHIPAAQAGVFTVMLPICSVLTGVLFLGERLSTTQVWSFVIALLGILLATLPSKTHRPVAAVPKETDGPSP